MIGRFGALLFLALGAAPALAQPSGQCPGDLPAFLEGQSGNDCTSTSQTGCQRGCNFVNNCRTPEVSEPSIAVEEQPDGTFTARLKASVRVPWNAWAATENPNGTADAVWYAAGSIPSCTQSATVATCSYTATDNFDTWIEFSGLTCDGAPYNLGTYSLRVKTCQQPCCGGPFGENCICATDTWKDVEGIPFTLTAGFLGCPQPPPEKCNGDSSCMSCFGGGVGGSGGPPGVGGPGGGDLGPGAKLRYAGDGAGVTGLPGAMAWKETLGQGWSHSYAQRLIPEETSVWLVTEYATYRKFSDPDASGVYQTAWPADEYRTLTDTGSGFLLQELDGTVHAFGSSGLWLSATDRHGNSKTATYTSGKLTEVAFPDERTELFTYHPSGKLASIVEVGVDGTTTRAWSLTWSGDDLVRLDRPDGTAYVFTYAAPNFPGYVTLQQLEGTDGSRRVVRSWEYTAEGNVSRTWAGTVSPDGSQVVDLWSFTWTNPTEPTEVTLTDPLGQVSTVQIGRHVSGGKVRVTGVSGDCPTCATGPNAQLFYEDPANPLRVTREVDGRGITTLSSYSSTGQLTSRTEAAGTPEERTTTWTYDPDFPALVTSEERPSAAGGASFRRTDWTRDLSGNATEVAISGVENGSAFLLTTETTFTAAGQVETVDPPGHGAADVTTYAYDATRGGLLVSSRDDPVLDTDTTYDYDPFHRRTSVTDPNGVETTTTFDDLNRVTEIRQKGASASEDLVTTHEYTVFGDLLRTTLPRGNVIEYGYDLAGRLVTVERKPDATTQGERTRYTLDTLGHRVREDLEHWDAASQSWVSESATEYEYSTRCHLDRIIQAPGTPEEAVTEYGYDCNGNLSAQWDANHDPATDPATTSYSYDSLDRMTSLSQPWGGAGGGSITTSYGYDVQNHLVAVIDAEGNLTTYEYSDRDLMTKETSPASGITTQTYTGSGQLATTTDARGITTAYTHDALDRVTFVDYPDDTLDITYTYDDGAVPYSSGRLTAIARNGGAVLYEYDRFGRTTRDGALIYDHDANGNRTTVGYPGGVTATYTHDFADREETLSVTTPSGTTDLVTASSYLPSGPLSSLALGNGLIETRTYDGRYAPTGYAVSGTTERSWTYTTDRVGNVLSITEQAGCSEPPLLLEDQTVTGTETISHCTSIEVGNGYAVEGDLTLQATGAVVLADGFSAASGGAFTAISEPAPDPILRTYAYQDIQYFLTQGDGPWGARAWSYDRIGNRLTETKDGLTDTYSYGQNTSGGNSPVLASIDLGVVGTRTFTHGPAGHLEQISTSPSVGTSLGYDDAGRLSDLTDLGSTEQTDMLYDGRSYLTSAVGSSASASPAYSSSGLLHSLVRPAESVHVLHFAGRPVGQVTIDGSGTESFLFYTTDHLGTPSLATDGAGGEVWGGGFEPFGKDWQRGMTAGASENGLALRLPGQFTSSLFLGIHGFAHNANRWYSWAWAGYSRPDPLPAAKRVGAYLYAMQRPTVLVDPLGLQAIFPSNDPFEDNCCTAALTKGLFAALGNPGGSVFCCNGEKVSCILMRDPGRLPPAARLPYRLSLDCIREHEEQHVADLPPCEPCSEGPVPLEPAKFGTSTERYASECLATIVELECLEKAKAQCGGNPECIDLLDTLKANPRDQRQEFGCHD